MEENKSAFTFTVESAKILEILSMSQSVPDLKGQMQTIMDKIDKVGETINAKNTETKNDIEKLKTDLTDLINDNAKHTAEQTKAIDDRLNVALNRVKRLENYINVASWLGGGIAAPIIMFCGWIIKDMIDYHFHL